MREASSAASTAAVSADSSRDEREAALALPVRRLDDAGKADGSTAAPPPRGSAECVAGCGTPASAKRSR